MPPALYERVLTWLQLRLAQHTARSFFTTGPGIPVIPRATFFDWVVISQRRYWAASRTKNATNSMIAVRDGLDSYKVGELNVIFAFKLGLPQLPFVRLGLVRFLKPVGDPYPSESAWSST
jgi:hypothetical protein